MEKKTFSTILPSEIPSDINMAKMAFGPYTNVYFSIFLNCYYQFMQNGQVIIDYPMNLNDTMYYDEMIFLLEQMRMFFSQLSRHTDTIPKEKLWMFFLEAAAAYSSVQKQPPPGFAGHKFHGFYFIGEMNLEQVEEYQSYNGVYDENIQVMLNLQLEDPRTDKIMMGYTITLGFLSGLIDSQSTATTPNLLDS